MEENKEQKKTKITILFGAGAEGEGQFNLPFGNEFKRDLIMGKGTKAFADQFLKDAKSGIELDERKIIDGRSSPVLYQTIVESIDPREVTLEKLFPKEEERETVRLYLEQRESDSKAKDGNLSNAFRRLYYKNFYKEIEENNILENEPVKYFLEHAGIYSYFDSLFNYLRKPELYKEECAKVMKIYYSALMSILNGFAKKLKDNVPAEFKNLKEGKAEEPFEDLCNMIHKFEDAIIKDVVNEQNCANPKASLYYYQIKELREKKDSQHDIRCITTNYTSIAQKIIDLQPEEIAYLHGKLTLFEELETKRIAGITEVDRKKTVFPYLLVQSGVKPIISGEQMKEFAKATEWISESEHLLIIGYGINSDDEHITNFLRERLHNKKAIKVFVYSEKKGDEKWLKETSRIKKELSDSEYIEFYHSSEFDAILSSL